MILMSIILVFHFICNSSILDFYVEVFENHFFGFGVPQSFVSLQHLSISLIYVLKDRQFEVVFLQASFLLAVTQFVV